MTDHRSGTIAEEELRDDIAVLQRILPKLNPHDPDDIELSARLPRVIAALQSLSHRTEPTSDAVERAARALAKVDGFDPDEDPNYYGSGRPMTELAFPPEARLWWRYRRNAAAALSTASPPLNPIPGTGGGDALTGCADDLIAGTERWSEVVAAPTVADLQASLATHKFDTSDYIIDPVGPRPLPEGFVLVPKEPTEAMLRAATMEIPTWDDDASRRKWRAMLAALLVEGKEQ